MGLIVIVILVFLVSRGYLDIFGELFMEFIYGPIADYLKADVHHNKDFYKIDPNMDEDVESYFTEGELGHAELEVAEEIEDEEALGEVKCEADDKDKEDGE